MRLAPGLILAALAGVPHLACNQPEPVDLVVVGATIVDVDDGDLVAGRLVVVRDGLIREVVSAERAADYAAASIVDGAGTYLLPALADAHVHIQGPGELDNYRRYGVGLVVNMAGGPMHLDLRDAVAAGRRAGPRVVTAGPTLDGTTPTNPLFTSVTPETAGEIIAGIAARGYDVIKVYQQIEAPALAAVIQAAGSAGLLTTGHVSRLAGIAGALDAGLRHVAHGEELAFESFDEATRRYERGGIPELADLLVRHGVTVTPMIGYLENVPPQVLDLDGYLGSDPMALVPAAMKLSFGARQGWFSNREEPQAFAGQMADLANWVAELTAALEARGVPLILGTDAGFGGAIPGYGVHQELRSLVRAGLSELAALQTATRNVGRYLQQVDAEREPWGRIAPGHSADLLLLRANPLADISASEEIEGVVLAGRWHGPEELAQLDRNLRGRQAAVLAPARAFEEALVGGDVEAARRALDSRPAGLAGESLISADNCVFLGYRHYYGGRRQLAGRLYELCARMHPDAASLWLHVARARESAGDVGGAIDAYERARAANPWYGQPGEAIRRLGAGRPQASSGPRP